MSENNRDNIQLTAAAAVFVQKSIGSDPAIQGIRVGVKSTGCSGLAYYLEPSKEERPEDRVFESHGISIFIDAKSFPYLRGTEIDCVQESLGEYLKFNNPNVKGACGCGESFTVESAESIEDTEDTAEG